MARTYELTDKGRGMEMTNQQKLIHNALLDGPRTVKQIAEAIKGTLVTRQPPEKVVGFYMSTWKKDGIVKESNDATPAPSNVEKTDEKQEITQLTEAAGDGEDNTPVSDGNDPLGSPSPAIEYDRAESVSAATDDERKVEQQREGESLMQFVFRLVKDYGPIQPIDIENATAGAIRKKQAQDTLRRLLGGQHIAKSESGYRAVGNNPYVG